MLELGGNTASVVWALERAGATPDVVDVHSDFSASERLVIPGQGHFGRVLERLEPGSEELSRFLTAERPLLGICVGLQLLFEGSDEDPMVPGLGLLNGRVNKLVPNGESRVPHLGWTNVDSPLEWVPSGYWYFVHSYGVHATEGEGYECATMSHGTHRYVAAAQRDQIWATQFHPEKSGTLGDVLLRKFLAR